MSLSAAEREQLRGEIMTSLSRAFADCEEGFDLAMELARAHDRINRLAASHAELEEELEKARDTWCEPSTGEPCDIQSLWSESVRRGQRGGLLERTLIDLRRLVADLAAELRRNCTIPGECEEHGHVALLARADAVTKP